ncbi:MAG: PAS domain S-box protein [Deltaproteobacteria bacterium]|nr:PAS domain S-box protein [Deltaproteobacteria bacterium]
MRSLVGESEERYRALFESMAQGVFFQRREGHIVDANAAALRLFGVSAEELYSRTSHTPAWTVVTEDGAPLPPDEHPSMVALRTGKPVENVTVGVFNPSLDAFVWVTVNAVPLFRPGESRPHQTFVTLHDVTRRRRAEEALRESRAKLAAALASMTDAVFISDAQGHFLDFNEAFATFHRFPSREACLKTFAEYPELFEVYFPDGSPAPVDAWAVCRALRGETVSNAEYSLRRRDTGETWVGSYNFSPIRDKGGAIVGSVVVARDVTDQKRAEAEKEQIEVRLRHAQKMEAMGTLAGGIAHDFNNILMPIMVHAELALMRVDDVERTREDLKEILASAGRAASLVNEILVISRRDPDRPLAPVPLAPLVKEATKFLRASLPATIEIRTEIDPSCGHVLADPSQLHQVLLNLCTNGAHAMKGRGGVLTVSLARATGEVRLTVRDTGAGIPADVLPRIFEPYFTTKPPGEGTGLGLAIVHGIVTKLGGEIRVESEAGAGTAFEIRLPEVAVDAGPEAPTPPEIPRGRGQHVLVVDDEAPVRRGLTQILTTLGYRATEAVASAEALATFDADPVKFDAVVTDYTMPGGDGLGLARELLRRRPGLPILLTTGFSETLSPQEVARSGVRSYLKKPYRIQTLAEALRDALGEQE